MNRLAGRKPRSQARGFTLVEMMLVVVLIAVLAAVATIGVRKYITATKTSEAINMLAAIKAAQEAYKGETHEYLDVSGVNKLDGYSTYYPRATLLKREKMQWGGGTGAVADAWRTLGVSATGPVYYIYGCAAGGGSVVPATPAFLIGNYPTAETGEPWYLAQAAAALDGGDEADSIFATTSFSSEIWEKDAK